MATAPLSTAPVINPLDVLGALWNNAVAALGEYYDRSGVNSPTVGTSVTPQPPLIDRALSAANDLIVNVGTGRLTVAQQAANSQSGAVQPLSQAEKDFRLGLVRHDAVSGKPATAADILPSVFSLPDFPSLDPLGNLPDLTKVMLWGAVLIFVLLTISVLND